MFLGVPHCSGWFRLENVPILKYLEMDDKRGVEPHSLGNPPLISTRPGQR